MSLVAEHAVNLIGLASAAVFPVEKFGVDFMHHANHLAGALLMSQNFSLAWVCDLLAEIYFFVFKMAEFAFDAQRFREIFHTSFELFFAQVLIEFARRWL